MTAYGTKTLFFESVSNVTATPSVEVGTIRDEGDERYIYVYNSGNSQASVGYGVTVSAVTGYSVTVSSTTSVDFCVGVVKHTTLTTGTYGWVISRGFCSAKATPNSGLAAGGLMVLGADGVFGQKDISTGFVGDVVGKVMVATASAGLADALICIY